MNLPDTPGLRLLSNGMAFWRAAKLLHEDDPKSLAWAPCFVNLGLAIEDMSLRNQVGTSVNLPLLGDAINVAELLMRALYIQCTEKYR